MKLMLSELGQATQRSMLTVLAVIVVSTVLGVSLGSLASRRGSFWDGLLGRLLELSGALHFLLAIPLLQHRWSMTTSTILALGCYQALRLARQSCDEMRFVRRYRFVLAARALGLSNARVEWSHVLPHAAPALAINVALTLPLVVSCEATLAFLDLDRSASLGNFIVTASPARFAVLAAVIVLTLVTHLAAERATRRLLPHTIDVAGEAPLARAPERSRKAVS